MKAPFYVIDNSRQLVFGRFFKKESADKVEALLRQHSTTQSRYEIRVIDQKDYGYNLMLQAVKRGDLRKGTEPDLQAIDGERYLPQPNYVTAHMQMFVGAVITIGGSQQFVVLSAADGRKWTEWKMRGLADRRPYSYKTLMGEYGKAKFVRMATPNEYHGAVQQRAEINERSQARVTNNRDKVDVLNIERGDVVTVHYRDVGDRTEVVEDINYKTGRVAIRRRGMDALVREKRRFVPATCIVKIVEKVGYYSEHNPLYAKYGFSNPTGAQIAQAREISVLDRLGRQLRKFT